jgi:hypothetical protein
MTQQSPFKNGLSVEPPEEMVHIWSEAIYAITEDDDKRDAFIASRAAQWGADRELEYCCAQLRECHMVPEPLREKLAVYLDKTRRPDKGKSGDTDVFDEFATYWWGPETENLYIEDMVENGTMAKFARAVLEAFKDHDF